MRDALRRLTADSAIYGLGQVLGRSVQLLLVPVLTRLLAPQAFGLAELVQGYMQTAVLVLVFGMDAALARFFYEQPDRADARTHGVELARVPVARLEPRVRGVHRILRPDRGRPARRRGQELVGIGAVTLPFTLLVMFSNDVLRVTFQPIKYIALNIVQTALVTALSILFVAHFHLGAAGVVWGRLAGDGLSAIAGLVLIRHSLASRFSRTLLRTMLSYGGPTVPGALGFAALSGMDRYVLQRTRSLEEVAVYAVALRFFAVMTFAASAFQLAYGPFAYARARRRRAAAVRARVHRVRGAGVARGARAVGVRARGARRARAAELSRRRATGARTRLCGRRARRLHCRVRRHRAGAADAAAVAVRLVGRRRRGRRARAVDAALRTSGRRVRHHGRLRRDRARHLRGGAACAADAVPRRSRARTVRARLRPGARRRTPPRRSAGSASRRARGSSCCTPACAPRCVPGSHPGTRSARTVGAENAG